MELHLQPRSASCCVSGKEFAEGDRVVSFLVREGAELKRLDCSAEVETQGVVSGEVLCRWTRVHKATVRAGSADRELRMTAESLFLALTEEGNPLEENADLKQFLALMLERKRVLKARGRSSEGRPLFFHAASNRTIEVPAGEMDAAFFVAVREKLGVLLGEPASPAVQPEQ
jgi:hypothetical protein